MVKSFAGSTGQRNFLKCTHSYVGMVPVCMVSSVNPLPVELDVVQVWGFNIESPMCLSFILANLVRSDFGGVDMEMARSGGSLLISLPMFDVMSASMSWRVERTSFS